MSNGSKNSFLGVQAWNSEVGREEAARKALETERITWNNVQKRKQAGNRRSLRMTGSLGRNDKPCGLSMIG